MWKTCFAVYNFLVEDGLEGGWDAKRYSLNEENHSIHDVLYYIGRIDVNYKLCGMGQGFDIKEELFDSHDAQNKNKKYDMEFGRRRQYIEYPWKY